VVNRDGVSAGIFYERPEIFYERPEIFYERHGVTQDRDAANSLRNLIRPEALAAPASGIAEVFHLGRTRPGLIPLYVGEGDAATSPMIAAAITRSLENGETFYSALAGLPELRTAIARYMSRHYGEIYERRIGPFAPERFFVTTGGMHALQLAVRLVAGTGDEVIVPTPAWPNFHGVLAAAGARVCGVPLDFAVADGVGLHWSLDLDRLRAAISPSTRAIIINSPANPTGWTAAIRSVDHRRRNLRPDSLWRTPGTVVPRCDGRRRPDHVRADIFEELGDDGAASGLARSAARTRRDCRQSHSLFDVGRRRALATRRHCGA
jgi:Aminotransferase class I and II